MAEDSSVLKTIALAGGVGSGEAAAAVVGFVVVVVVGSDEAGGEVGTTGAGAAGAAELDAAGVTGEPVEGPVSDCWLEQAKRASKSAVQRGK